MMMKVVAMQKNSLFLHCEDPDIGAKLNKIFTKLEFQSSIYESKESFINDVKEERPSCIGVVSGKDMKADFVLLTTIRKEIGIGIPLYYFSQSTHRKILDAAEKFKITEVIRLPTKVGNVAIALSKLFKNKSIHTEKKKAENMGAEAFTIDADIPEIATYSAPEILKTVMQTIIPQISQLFVFFEDLDEQESRVKFYLSHLKDYEENYSKIVDSMKRGEDKLTLEQMLRLFGVNNSRNFLYTVRLAELIKPEALKWDETTGKPNVEVNESLQFALASVAHFGEESRDRNMALMSGILIDYLSQYGKERSKAGAKLKGFVEALFESAKEEASKAIKIGRKMENLSLAKYLIPTTFLRYSGRLLFAILEDSYLDWYAKIEKNEWPDDYISLLERKKFGTTSAEIGALIGSILFDDKNMIFESVYFSENPILLKNESDPATYRLALASHKAHA